MTTVYASNLVPVSKLFPKVKSGNTADGVDTSAITSLEATAEDIASSDTMINQMLVADAPSYTSGGGGASQLFSILA